MSFGFLYLVVLNHLWGCFERKKAMFGPSGSDLEGHLPTWRLQPGLPLLGWGLKLGISESHVSMQKMARVE